MSHTLNRDAPYSHCYGTGAAKFYQGGRYFDGSGRELTRKDENGEFIENEPLVAAEPEKPGSKDAGPATPDVAVLKKLSTFAVKSIFLEAGGDPEKAKGKGAKQRMIDWLAEQLD